MTGTSPALGRPADRKKLILAQLRGQIASGKLRPGTQLPTRSEISQHYGASLMTVQSALDDLKRDGFIVVKGRHGTYVAPNPPHLKNYALVFPASPRHHSWRRFWSALEAEAAALQTTQDHNVTCYYNINLGREGEHYEKLSAEVSGHLVAGIIFSTVPFEILHTPLLDEPDTPRVAIMSQTHNLQVPYLFFDDEMYWAKILGYLKGQGRHRVGVLLGSRAQEYVDHITGKLGESGFASGPSWVQCVDLSYPTAVRNLIHLWLHAEPSYRPEALIIADDNLVEACTITLAELAVSAPDELEVIAHANFPHLPPVAVPVRWFGYDIRQVLHTCIQSIDAQRQGQAVSEVTPVNPRWERELTAVD